VSPSKTRLLALRTDVARRETALRSAVSDLGVATRSAADPKHWIRERPFACVVGAFAVGLWLGGRGRAQA
jgi:hypothetical protein